MRIFKVFLLIIIFSFKNLNSTLSQNILWSLIANVDFIEICITKNEEDNIEYLCNLYTVNGCLIAFIKETDDLLNFLSLSCMVSRPICLIIFPREVINNYIRNYPSQTYEKLPLFAVKSKLVF